MLIRDFNKMYCLNLKRRPDRLARCKEIFSEYKLDVTFIEAVDGKELSEIGDLKPGEAGCCLSHRNLLESILEDKSIKTALIMEDDVEFINHMPTYFSNFYKDVPKDWHLLYFGGSHRWNPLNRISPHVHKLKKTYTTHCYGIKREAIVDVLAFFAKERIFLKAADLHLAEYQKISGKCYGFLPSIAWQRADYSDIREDFKDYKHIR